MGKNISKTCQTINQAARYQNSLYNKYEVVRLVSSPFIGEKGIYTWFVESPI